MTVGKYQKPPKSCSLSQRERVSVRENRPLEILLIIF
jgi:hypothetical protein